MTQTAWTIGILTLAILACPVLAKDAAAPAAPAKSAAGADYSVLFEKGQLTEDQAKQLRQIIQERDAALQQWKQENSEKLSQARAAARKAKQQGDEQAVKAAGQQIKELQDQQNRILATANQKVLAQLSDQQKALLAAQTLRNEWQGRFRRSGIELTDQQQATIEGLIDQAATELAKVSDAKATRAVVDKLNKSIADALTPQQREKLPKTFGGQGRQAKPESQEKPEKPESPKPETVVKPAGVSPAGNLPIQDEDQARDW